MVTGKDKAFNSEILGARQLVDKVIEMADEAAKDYAENNGLIHETAPYDKKFYGALSDI